MSKLLVDTPSGKQEIVEVGVRGGYFDPSRILWDERRDGALPNDLVIGGMVLTGGTLVFDQNRMAAHLEASKPAVPKVITMRQARLALLDAGLLSQVSVAIASLPSPDKECAEIEWEYALVIERRSPLVDVIASLLPLSPAEVDALFISADKL